MPKVNVVVSWLAVGGCPTMKLISHNSFRTSVSIIQAIYSRKINQMDGKCPESVFGIEAGLDWLFLVGDGDDFDI